MKAQIYILILAVGLAMSACVSSGTRDKIIAIQQQISVIEAKQSPSEDELAQLVAFKRQLEELKKQAGNEKTDGWIYGLDVSGATLSGFGSILALFVPGSGLAIAAATAGLKAISNNLKENRKVA